MKKLKGALVSLLLAIIASLLVAPAANATSSDGCEISGISDAAELTTAVTVHVSCNNAYDPNEINVTGTGVGVWRVNQEGDYLVFPNTLGSATLAISDGYGETADVNFTNGDAGDLYIHISQRSRRITPIDRPFSVASYLTFEGASGSSLITNEPMSYQYTNGCESMCTALLGDDGLYTVKVDPWAIDSSFEFCTGSNEPVHYFDQSGNDSPSDSWQYCSTFSLSRAATMGLTVWRQGSKVSFIALGRDPKQSSLRMKNAAPLSCAFQVERKVGSKWKKVKASGWPKYSSLGQNVDYIRGTIVSKGKVKLRTRYTGCNFTEKTRHVKVARYKHKKQWICIYWGALCYWYKWREPVYKTYYTKKHFHLPSKLGAIKSA